MDDRRILDEEFKRQICTFMGKIDEHMSNQKETCLSHKDDTKKALEAIYGNGKIGINAKILLIYVVIVIMSVALGADHPWVLKLVSRLG